MSTWSSATDKTARLPGIPKKEEEIQHLPLPPGGALNLKVARVGSKCWLYHIPDGTGAKQGHDWYRPPAQREGLGPPPPPGPQVISNDECVCVYTKYRWEEDTKHNIHKLYIRRSMPGVTNYLTHDIHDIYMIYMITQAHMYSWSLLGTHYRLYFPNKVSVKIQIKPISYPKLTSTEVTAKRSSWSRWPPLWKGQRDQDIMKLEDTWAKILFLWINLRLGRPCPPRLCFCVSPFPCSQDWLAPVLETYFIFGHWIFSVRLQIKPVDLGITQYL